MASEGPNSPSTGVDDATVGTETWGDPDNALVSDNSDASVLLSGGDVSHYLRVTDFGFSIPAGATIDGIIVEVERADSNDDTVDSSIRLYNGSFVGDNKSAGASWPTSDTYDSFGGSTDDWNAGLDATDINSSSFGVGISATAAILGTPAVDHIRITVHYTESQTELYGIASETDSGLAIAVAKEASYGIASETDAALALAAEKLVEYGIASETDEALEFVRKYTYGAASETDAALEFVAELSQLAEYAAATETDIALAFHTSKVRGGVYIPMGSVHSPFMLRPQRRRNRRPDDDR